MRVLCDCGRHFEADDALAGQSAHCPHCSLTVRLPATLPPACPDRESDDPSQDTHAPLEEVQPEDDDFALLARLARQKRMRVTCGACAKMLAVSRLLAGKKRVCPACGVGIQIPQLPDIDEPAPGNHRPAPPQETLPGSEDIKADRILALVSHQDPAPQEADDATGSGDSQTQPQPAELAGVSWETLILVSLLALLVGLGAGLAYAHRYWVPPAQATPPASAPDGRIDNTDTRENQRPGNQRTHGEGLCPNSVTGHRASMESPCRRLLFRLRNENPLPVTPGDSVSPLTRADGIS